MGSQPITRPTPHALRFNTQPFRLFHNPEAVAIQVALVFPEQFARDVGLGFARKVGSAFVDGAFDCGIGQGGGDQDRD